MRCPVPRDPFEAYERVREAQVLALERWVLTLNLALTGRGSRYTDVRAIHDAYPHATREMVAAAWEAWRAGEPDCDPLDGCPLPLVPVAEPPGYPEARRQG